MFYTHVLSLVVWLNKITNRKHLKTSFGIIKIIMKLTLNYQLPNYYTQNETRGHSAECIRLPHHVEIGSVCVHLSK